MLLTADIGNTNIVLALLDEKDRVVSQCRVPSGETLPPEAYDDAIRRVLEGQAAPEGAVIGSVVPRLTAETADAIRRALLRRALPGRALLGRALLCRALLCGSLLHVIGSWPLGTRWTRRRGKQLQEATPPLCTGDYEGLDGRARKMFRTPREKREGPPSEPSRKRAGVRPLSKAARRRARCHRA